MADYYPNLNPKKALIWRIVHRDNLPWILENGLYCSNSGVQVPGWVSIGNPELIDKRAKHPVPLPPGGFLNDYIPFYFTPFSPMLRNIFTGICRSMACSALCAIQRIRDKPSGSNFRHET